MKPVYANFDVNALYAALDLERDRRGASWSQVAREAGVSASTIQRLRTGGAMEADGILQMLRWLGRSIESFVPGADRGEELPQSLRDRSVAVVRFNTRAIFDALESRRVASGITWRQVATEIGGTNATSLTRLRDGGRIELSLVMRVVDWLGVPVASVIHVTTR